MEVSEKSTELSEEGDMVRKMSREWTKAYENKETQIFLGSNEYSWKQKICKT